MVMQKILIQVTTYNLSFLYKKGFDLEMPLPHKFSKHLKLIQQILVLTLDVFYILGEMSENIFLGFLMAFHFSVDF